jgi:hypothetical protein
MLDLGEPVATSWRPTRAAQARSSRRSPATVRGYRGRPAPRVRRGGRIAESRIVHLASCVVGDLLDLMRDRHQTWGDDPEERDADATVAELAGADQTAWHDHALFLPLKFVGRFIARSGKRIAVTIVGVAVLIVGIAGLLLPILPGWALIFVGLGILATEYVWARRLLLRAKTVAVTARDKALRKKPRAAGADTSPPV